MYQNNYIEINLDNIAYNVKHITNRYNNYQYYFGMLKADAYGHGLVKVAEEIIKNGINYLIVSNLDDALKIRNKIRYISILCLEPIAIENINIAIKNNITITISSYKYYQELMYKKVNNELKVHIKIDPTLNQSGIKNKMEFDEMYLALINDKKINLEGLYTDLTNANDLDSSLFDEQVNKFLSMTKDIDLDKIPIVHLYNSSALLSKPKLKVANGVRLGICMYGINPIKHKELDIKLRPAMALYSKILEIKNIKTGEYIGSKESYQAKNDMMIGIVPIGFSDGIQTKNTGRNTSINGVRYKIIGDISMNMLTIYIDDNVNVGDKIALIGEIISIDEIASYLGMTCYEVITSINGNITKKYIKNEKEVK